MWKSPGRTSFSRERRAIWGGIVFSPLFLVAGFVFANAVSAQSPSAPKCPPAARIDSAKDTYGTSVVPDPYRWLEDQNSAETRSWIDAEQKDRKSTRLNSSHLVI